MADADTKEEFIKSFQEGHFGLKIKDEIFPARIAGTRNVSRNILPLSYMATKDGKYLSFDLDWTTQREMLIRDYPDLGCVKMGPTVGYLSTHPKRQFKKGYVPANVGAMIPNQTQIRRIFSRFIASSGSKDVIWQVFRRERWEPKEAIRLMDEGDGVGYPLSKDFGVYLNADLPNPLILCKTHDVGVFDGEFKLFKNFSFLAEQFERQTETKIGVCR
jgi:hypothetical protein